MNDLNSSYFLPTKFKKIGWGLIGVHLLVILLLYVLFLFGVRNFGGIEHFIFPLLHYTVMIGLTIVISSREKKEDEMIRLIRLKSFQYGLYLTILMSFVIFILSLTGNQNIRLFGRFGIEGIDATLIFIVVIYQFKLYQLRNDEE